MRRFVAEICDAECGSRKINGQKFDVFATQIWGRASQNFRGSFVNRHHFRPTGRFWVRSHGWSFVYADEIKKLAVKYNGLAFGGHNYRVSVLLITSVYQRTLVSLVFPL